MFSVKLANFEMFTASGESTVKCLDRLDFRRPRVRSLILPEEGGLGLGSGGGGGLIFPNSGW